jgi:hypothetical protein
MDDARRTLFGLELLDYFQEPIELTLGATLGRKPGSGSHHENPQCELGDRLRQCIVGTHLVSTAVLDSLE